MLSVNNVIDALVLGLSLATIFGMGPAFFTLVQTSIDRGFKSALLFAIGVAANDIVMILLCIMTSVQVVIEGNDLYFGIAAGIMVILFGLFTYRRKAKPQKTSKDADADTDMPIADNNHNGWTFLMKGFALNILNPFVWLFWITSVALVSGQMEGNRVAVSLFFAITIGVCLTCDTLKAYGAAALKRFFNPRRIVVMNKLTGIILMLFGVGLIVQSILKFLGHTIELF